MTTNNDIWGSRRPSRNVISFLTQFLRSIDVNPMRAKILSFSSSNLAGDVYHSLGGVQASSIGTAIENVHLFEAAEYADLIGDDRSRADEEEHNGSFKVV